MFITSPAAIGLRTIIYHSEDIEIEIEIGRSIVCKTGIAIGQLAKFQAEVVADRANSDLDVDINICKLHDGDGDKEI